MVSNYESRLTGVQYHPTLLSRIFVSMMGALANFEADAAHLQRHHSCTCNLARYLFKRLSRRSIQPRVYGFVKSSPLTFSRSMSLDSVAPPRPLASAGANSTAVLGISSSTLNTTQ